MKNQFAVLAAVFILFGTMVSPIAEADSTTPKYHQLEALSKDLQALQIAIVDQAVILKLKKIDLMRGQEAVELLSLVDAWLAKNDQLLVLANPNRADYWTSPIFSRKANNALERIKEIRNSVEFKLAAQALSIAAKHTSVSDHEAKYIQRIANMITVMQADADKAVSAAQVIETGLGLPPM